MALRQVMRGLGYLEYYGHHPGWPWFFGLTILGAVAGGWIGLGVSVALWGAVMAVGAYGRARDHDRLMQKLGRREDV